MSIYQDKRSVIRDITINVIHVHKNENTFINKRNNQWVYSSKQIQYLKVPYLENTYFCVFILIVNIIFPGVGTMFLACCFDKTNISPEEVSLFRTFLLIVGLIQFLTAFCILGWIWSIATGFFLVQASCKYKDQISISEEYI